MPPQATERPATLDEIISAIAKKEGVSPALALAVAKKESSLRPDAVGDSGKAIGLFQLHEGAAADTGVTDRANPVQNITGGIRYLKQLSDRYDGDVSKILMAYNGGMGNVDAGTVSAAAKQYADDIIGSFWTAAQTAAPRPTPAPTPGVSVAAARGPREAERQAGSAQPGDVPPEEPGLLMSMVQSFDPRTTEGRINLGATAAATVATGGVGGLLNVGRVAATRAGMTGVKAALSKGVVPWIARVLAPPVAAGAAGGSIMAAERAVGTAPEGARTPGQEALVQGGLEAAGGAFMWLPRRVARTFLSSRIGHTARQTLAEMKRTFQSGMKSARRAGSEMIQAVQNKADDTLSAVQKTGRTAEAAVKGATREAEKTAERVASEGVQQAAEQAQKSLADAELEAAELVADATRQYERIAQPPSVMGTAEATRKVASGLPGIPGATGPAKRALDIAGKEIDKAAEVGLDVAMKPIQEALSAMGDRARPKSIFGTVQDTQQTRGVGFGQNADRAAKESVRFGPAASRAAKEFKDTTVLKAGTPEYERALAMIRSNTAHKFTHKELGVSESHPLPGILGQIADAPENISFRDAHQLKRLLDEAVNWDVTAKRHLTAITKGIRETLRGAMRDAGNEAYEAATSKYAQLVPLYRKGVGREILKAAADNPDKIARILDPKAPDEAIRLRKLLVDQSAAGGDEAAGREAWDALRASFTYDKIIKGGAEGMGDRLHNIIEGHPEFAREVFGDEKAQQILSNIDRIAEAYKVASARAAERVGAAKATGKAGIEAAKSRGAATLKETKEVGNVALETTKRQTADQIAAARRSGRTAVQAAKEARTQAVETQRAGIEDIRTKERRLRESSIGTGSKKELETAGADVTRAVVLRGTIWAMLSTMRLLNGPKAADLIEWAAYSNKNTQVVTNLLLSPMNDRAAAAGIRSLMGVVGEEFEGPSPKESQPAVAVAGSSQ